MKRFYVFLAATLIFALGYWCVVEKMANVGLKEKVNYYESTYLFQAGSTTYQGEKINYQFASLDGGQNWYSVQTVENRGLKVIGPVDQGLFKAVSADDKLFDYIAKHGPIGSDDPLGTKLLNDAGITIQKKP